jgi:outer membrane protein OmpA-like peptidoglycan-associated protein
MGNTTHKNNAANLKWKNDKSFIDFLKKYPNVQVEIAVHTDSDADKSITKNYHRIELKKLSDI